MATCRSATLQVGYVTFLPVDPVLQLAGAPEHPLYPFALAIAAIEAQNRGDLQAAEAHCSHALEAAATARLRPRPSHRDDRRQYALRCLVRRPARSLDAATHMEHAVDIARATGHPALCGLLGSAAMYRTMAGDNDTAVRLATEGLALARQQGAPTPISICLTALAGALADTDHERARLVPP